MRMLEVLNCAHRKFMGLSAHRKTILPRMAAFKTRERVCRSDRAFPVQRINLRSNCCFVDAKPSAFTRCLQKPSCSLPPVLLGRKVLNSQVAFCLLYSAFLFIFLKHTTVGRKTGSGAQKAIIHGKASTILTLYSIFAGCCKLI